MSLKTLLLASLMLPFLRACAQTEIVYVGVDSNKQKGIGFAPTEIQFYPTEYVVSFRFESGIHSAVQSTFDNPCTPLSGGFDSGIQNVSQDQTLFSNDSPHVEWQLNFTDTPGPSWFFDQASGDCSKGAVFVVNPTANQTFDAFQAKAMGGSSSGSGKGSNGTVAVSGGRIWVSCAVLLLAALVSFS